MKTILSTIYSVVIGSLSLTATLASAQDASAPKEGTDGGTAKPESTPGAKTIKKKITKVKSALGESGEEGGSSGVGASKQEPKPAKYGGEVEFQFGYTSGSSSSQPNVEGSDVTKNTDSTMSLGITYQFIFGHFGVGPILQYSSSATKQTIGTQPDTTTTVTSTGLGLAAEYFLFDIQTDKMVPFAVFNYLITSGSNSTKSANSSADEQKTTNSGNQMGLGGGIKYFLARHVSLDPALWYVMTANTVKNGDASTKNSGNDIRLVATLSTYF